MHQGIEKKDHSECGKHMVQMVAPVKWPRNHNLNHQAHQKGQGQGDQHTQQKGIRKFGEGCAKISANHV